MVVCKGKASIREDLLHLYRHGEILLRATCILFVNVNAKVEEKLTLALDRKMQSLFIKALTLSNRRLPRQR